MSKFYNCKNPSLKILFYALRFTHLNKSLDRDYALLARRLARRKLNHDVNLGKLSHGKPFRLTNLRTSSLRARIYSNLSLFSYLLNIVKYSLLIAIQEGFFDIRFNCYLPGRFSLNMAFARYMPALALQLAVLQSTYRFVILKCKSCFEIDVVLFLVQDIEDLQEEIRNVEMMNRDSNQDVSFPNNILQMAMFYQIQSKYRNKYRLRPNRTFESRLELISKMRYLLLGAFVVGCIVLTVLAIGSFVNMVFDVCFIKSYPTCCPEMENLVKNGQVSGWSFNFGICRYRMFAFVFDLIDNTTFLLDNSIVIFFLGGMTYIITEDLLSYWKYIDQTISSLLLVLIYKLHFTHKRGDCRLLDVPIVEKRRELELTKNLAWINSGIPGSSETEAPDIVIEERIIELQGMIEDFFDSLARAGKFVGLLVKLAMAYYITCNIVLLYFTSKIGDFWSLSIARVIIFNVNSAFFASAYLATRIKTATDRTYTRLCSLVAHDRSRRVEVWVKILENYTHLKRNNYTVARKVPFIWPYALNVMTTSLSSFIIFETFRRFESTPEGV